MPAVARRIEWAERRLPDATGSRAILWVTFADDGEAAASDGEVSGAAAQVAWTMRALLPWLRVERMRLGPSQPPPLDEEFCAIECAAAVILESPATSAWELNTETGERLRAHPLVQLLKRLHLMEGLPLLATDGACALLCGRHSLSAFEVHALAAPHDVRAACCAAPPPVREVVATRYEAPPERDKPGHGFHDVLVDRWKKVDTLGRAPPLRLPEEQPDAPGWAALLQRCARCRQTRFAYNLVGLLPGGVLCVVRGRVNACAHRCVPLGRRQADLAQSVGRELAQLRLEWACFEQRLREATRAHGAEGTKMEQLVPHRRHWLCVLSAAELRRWIFSGGRSFFDNSGLDVEERMLASDARLERLCRDQLTLAERQREVAEGFPGVVPHETTRNVAD
jgi:hypothetical protein